MSRVNREEKFLFEPNEAKQSAINCELLLHYRHKWSIKSAFYFVPVNAEFRIKLHQQQPVAFLFFPFIHF